MASKMNELAVIQSDGAVSIVPSAEDVSVILEELKDMDRLPYGRIKIAPGGVNVFQITDPGEEDSTPAQSVEGVIFLSHKTNGLWLSAFGGENKAPDCSSIDGEEGTRTSTGECIACATCPYNQFGSDNGGQGRGKACKNMRRLYIMRRGDIFPMLLTLPPTALRAYDNYRTKIMLGRRRMSAIMTRITLKSEKNKDGVAYSSPVFEAVGLLSPDDCKAMEQYAASFSAAAKRMGVTTDDFVAPASEPTEVTPPEDMPWNEASPDAAQSHREEQQYMPLA